MEFSASSTNIFYRQNYKSQILSWKSWINSDAYISCLSKYEGRISLKWEFKTLNKTEYSFPKIDEGFFDNFIPEFTLGNYTHIESKS